MINNLSGYTIRQIIKYELIDNEFIKKDYINRKYFCYMEDNYINIDKDEYNRIIKEKRIGNEQIIKNYYGFLDKIPYSNIVSLLKSIMHYCDNLKINGLGITLKIYTIKRWINFTDGRSEDYILQRFELYISSYDLDDTRKEFRIYDKVDGYLSDLENNLENIFNLASRINELVLEKKHSVTVKNGYYECILSPVFGSLLIHESIGHFAEADVFLKKRKYKIPHKICNKKINIIDYGFSEEQNIPCPVNYDDEGNIAKNLRLVNIGILENLLTDNEYANNYNLEKTGNSRFGFANKKMIRMRNTCLMPDKESLSELIKSIRFGYYLVLPGTGYIFPNGLFELEILLGYRIENGKICETIKNMYAVSNTKLFFNSISNISNKIIWTSAECIKNKQIEIVGMGSPV